MFSFLKKLFSYGKNNPSLPFILILVIFSVYLMRPLFNWNNYVLGSDASGSWAWFYWFKESIFTYHQFPSWSPLWMGGMPFFGMVPPAGYFLVMPFYLILGDIPAAYNLLTITMFTLAGISMYLYLRYISKKPLLSFLGSIVYLLLPIHISGMMLNGHVEIVCTYALVPFILLVSERFLDGKKQINLVILSLLVSIVLLLQIEYALIFLLFYICYLIINLIVRRMGFYSVLALIRNNKVGILISFLILLLPISFYLSVIAQYSNFSGITKGEIEGGLQFYTLKHFNEVFQTKASNYLDSFNIIASEDYIGPITFVIIFMSILSLLFERDRKRIIQLLFFLIMGLLMIIISMGIYGPVFPLLRKIITPFQGIRVPVRFYYIFALCFPVIITLTFLSWGKILNNKMIFMYRLKPNLLKGIPIILIILLVVDLSTYFNFYHNRVWDKDEYYKASNYLQKMIKKDYQLGEDIDNTARVLFIPFGGNIPDYLSRIKIDGDSEITIEIAQSWLSWDQYKDVRDFYQNDLMHILESELNIDFYSDLLSIDYILINISKIPPAVADNSSLYQIVHKLDMICNQSYPLLASKGSLDTEYYTVFLYKINGGISTKVKFYNGNNDLFIFSNNKLKLLYQICKIVKDNQINNLLNRIISVDDQEELQSKFSINEIFIDDFSNTNIPLMPSNILEAKFIEAESCIFKGWVGFDRELNNGIATSGFNMAVTDVVKEEDNYLVKKFYTSKAGTWNLYTSYLSFIDTGKLDVYIDNILISIIDTYNPNLLYEIKEKKDKIVLDQGWHELRLVGKPNDHDILTGSKGHWVEVDKVILVNQALIDKISSINDNINDSWKISNYQLTPIGISLDIDTGEEGVLSVSYFDNPWWRIFIDGKEASKIVVDGLFPACYIYKGQHHVEFIYNYPSLFNMFSLFPR